METIEKDGVSYTKASVLARRNGYTADYLGQLCRAKKVDCVLVGRSWYINGAALSSHIENKYKSTRTNEIINKISIKFDHSSDGHGAPERVSAPLSKKTKRIVLHQFDSPLVPFVHSSSTEREEIGTQYEPDSSELVPTPIKVRAKNAAELEVPLTRIEPIKPMIEPRKVAIVPAESERIPIRIEDSRLKFEIEEPEPVILQGIVNVKSLEEPDLEKEPEFLEEPAKPKPKTKKKAATTPKVVASSNPFMPAHIQVNNHRALSRKLLLTCMLMTGFGLSFLAASTEAFVTASSAAFDTTIVFNFEKVFDAIRGLVFQQF